VCACDGALTGPPVEVQIRADVGQHGAVAPTSRIVVTVAQNVSGVVITCPLADAEPATPDGAGRAGVDG